MALRLKIELAVAGLLLAFVGLGFRAWVEHVKADAKMTATVGALQDVIQQKEAERDVLRKRMEDRDAAYQSQLAQVETKFRAAQSPQQIAQLVAEVMGLKQPVTLVQSQPTAQESQPAQIAQVPEIDFPQIKAYVSECETCKLERSVLQADAEDRIKEMALAQQQIDALAKQRDSAIEANKGGSFLQRLGRNVKYLVLGAAVGAIATRAAH